MREKPMLSKMYQYKFYLDANHFVTLKEQTGEVHPHTWEISLVIEVVEGSTIPFYQIEELIKTFLGTYQNTQLNCVAPFDEINPTLENIGDYFTKEVEKLISQKGWKLRNFTISETPSRSYITVY